MNLRASDDSAKKRALAYLAARDEIAAPYLQQYPKRLPKRISRLIHQRALEMIRVPQPQICDPQSQKTG